MASKESIGERRWLWSKFSGKPGDHADILVISAHGGQAGTSFTIPAGTKVLFYAPEAHALNDPSLDAMVYGKIIAKESFDPGLVCPDYGLTKYQGKKHGSASENYAKVERVVGTTYYGSKQAEVDVLTIRSRWARVDGPDATLGNTLTLLHQMGYRYSEIRCSFCRSTSDLFDNRSFSPHNIEKGKKPTRFDRRDRATSRPSSW